jgi:predicted oxidoreductase
MELRKEPGLSKEESDRATEITAKDLRKALARAKDESKQLIEAEINNGNNS